MSELIRQTWGSTPSATGPGCVKTPTRYRSSRSCLNSEKDRLVCRPRIYGATRFSARFLVTASEPEVFTQPRPKPVTDVRLARRARGWLLKLKHKSHRC